MMFGSILVSLRRRKAIIRDAEKLVGAFGARGVAMAEGFAVDPNVSAERRQHFATVAHHARRRNDHLSSLDTASRYLELGRISRRS